ncbi:MAG: polyhydroxyalkanoic acid system family protein [Agriterribacter sp.]
MSKLSMNIPHQLPREQAMERIKKLFGQLKEEQAHNISNVKENWQGEKGNFGFTARGFDLQGKINVTDNSVDIDADLPFAVSLFKSKIKNIINEKATELLKG